MGVLAIRGSPDRNPDIFLSYRSGDRPWARKLADALTFCEVDVWFDQWELKPGKTLYDELARATSTCRLIAPVLAENFSRSSWVKYELTQALHREDAEKRTVLVPLVCSDVKIPRSIRDRVRLDFRSDYYVSLTKLAALVHGIEQKSIDDAIQMKHPDDIRGVRDALQNCGKDPYIVFGKDDFDTLVRAGKAGGVDVESESRLWFEPQTVLQYDGLSNRFRALLECVLTQVVRSP